MTINQKSKKRLSNYRKNNNRKSIRTRKNNNLGKRRTIKGGAATTVAPPVGALPVDAPDNGEEKLPENLIKITTNAVRKAIDREAAGAEKLKQNFQEIKKKQDREQIRTLVEGFDIKLPPENPVVAKENKLLINKELFEKKESIKN